MMPTEADLELDLIQEESPLTCYRYTIHYNTLKAQTTMSSKQRAPGRCGI